MSYPLFCHIGDNILLKFWQIASDHIPDNGVIYLEIFMDDVISHACHHLPWCLRVGGFEFKLEASPMISMFLTIA